MREPGPINRKEVIVFQNAHGLIPDGIVGDQSWGYVMDNLFYRTDASLIGPVVIGIFIAALLVLMIV